MYYYIVWYSTVNDFNVKKGVFGKLHSANKDFDDIELKDLCSKNRSIINGIVIEKIEKISEKEYYDDIHFNKSFDEILNNGEKNEK